MRIEKQMLNDALRILGKAVDQTNCGALQGGQVRRSSRMCQGDGD